MPNLEGEETMPLLDLPSGVRWLPSWEGSCHAIPRSQGTVSHMQCVSNTEMHLGTNALFFSTSLRYQRSYAVSLQPSVPLCMIS